MSDTPPAGAGLVDATDVADRISAAIEGTAVAVLDADCRVIHARGAFFSRHGLGEAEGLIGRRMNDILPAEAWDRVSDHYQAMLGGTRRLVEYRTLDGRRHYSIHFVPWRAGDEVVGGLVISAERPPDQPQEPVERNEGRRAALLAVALRALEGGDVSSVLQASCELLAPAVQADLVGVFEPDNATGDLALRAGVGWEPGSLLRSLPPWEDATPFERPSGALLAGHGAVTGAAARIDHPSGSGALAAFRRVDEPFGEADRAALDTAAEIVAAVYARDRSDQELRHRALHDSLTGLPNRILLMDRLSLAIERSRRERTIVAVLFVDIDGFKAVNDRLGHRAGDQVLRAVADAVREQLRATDTLARLGGDEFVVVADGLTDPEWAERLAQRMREAFDAPLAIGGAREQISVSVGTALGSAGDVSAAELLHRADAAMYRAKRSRD